LIEKADLGGNNLSGSSGHMRKNAFFHRNLKWTFEDLLSCYVTQ